MQKIVLDNNIWIDLETVALHEKIFKLPYRICIPDTIFDEECSNERKCYLEKNNVEIIEFSSEEILKIAEENNLPPKVSFNDITALFAAKNNNAFLVTRDKNLIKHTKKYKKLICKSTEWLIEELVCNNAINVNEAINTCEKLTDRFKSKELEEIIEKYTEAALENNKIKE